MPDAPATCLCGHAEDRHHQIVTAVQSRLCDAWPCICGEYAPDLTLPLPMETT